MHLSDLVRINNKHRKTWYRLLPKLLLPLCLFAPFLYALVDANLDFATGPYHLFMDELIIFDGVQAILHPKSFSDFIYSVTDGGDHRYGRILWNISALASWVPDLIFGAKGQIIATRLLLALALLASYWLLARTFVLGAYEQILTVFALVSLPHTVYYSTSPKPEPLQLLFLAIFLHGFTKFQQKRVFYWFFLGLAFGAKISTIIIIPIFFVASVFLPQFAKQFSATKLWLVAALKGGVTALRNKHAYVPILYVLLGLVCAVPILGKFQFKTWVQWTFLKTTHGSDNAAISWRDWLHFIGHDYIEVPWLILCVVGCVLAAMTLYELLRFLTDRLSSRKITNQLFLVLAAAGLSFILVIILTVKRLWGFYLHPGMVLLLVAFFLLISRRARNGFSIVTDLRISYSTLLFSIFALVMTMPFMHNLRELHSLASRSSSPIHAQKEQQYRQILNFLKNAGKQSVQPLQVYLDPHLYRIESSKEYIVKPFWGFFTQWVDGADFIIYQRSHYEIPNLPETHREFVESRLARELLRKHVDNPKCTQHCYTVLVREPKYLIIGKYTRN
jgi:hypothetical protein